MKRFLMVSMAFFLTVAVMAQEKEKQSRKEILADKKELKAIKVDSIVAEHSFTFIAQSVNPVGWPSVHLSPIYEMKIKSDSVFVYLPFYGRAYQIDYSSSEGGFHFNALILNYEIDQKKEQYEIRFEAKSKNDQLQFYLSVYQSGYASLTVTSNNRQTIGYSGILKEVEKSHNSTL